eukprot:CAMPEP_0198198980 /NCGR_PEP_ID=MMETSP1445-20131203/2326_1 /TAXON_ID=36898 /ORGANISM="Pyramimonas sp., Strain CCMP2087" /LENGTH=121 /DNA_ID=CAMNT_0043868671 /DNA_START=95 /DNA_END=457 /DNA_ORIENTATION=+
MVQRLTYRRRHSYATKSNRTRVLKTPGGKLALHYHTKRPAGPKCGEPSCGLRLAGVPRLRPRAYHTLSKGSKNVQRAYGGVLCSNCVRTRIVRAFLVEEQKIVKKVLKIQMDKEGAKEETK